MTSRLSSIVRMGNPVLRKVSTPFEQSEIMTPKTRDLISEFKQILNESKGVGLAMPQIGQSKRLISIQLLEQECSMSLHFTVLFNPQIEFFFKHETIWMLESCLSIPNYVGRVKRYNNVLVHYLDENCNEKKIAANGYIAGLLQHEIDHLNGILYIDHLQSFHDFSMLSRFQYLYTNDIVTHGEYKFK